MTKSIYDSCFFFCNKLFVVIRLLTDGTLIFATNAFATYKEKAIHIAKIIIKLREQLDVTHSIKFNNVKIRISEDGSFYLNPNSHAFVQWVK